MDKFINIECTPENMDLYYVRHSIKQALDKALPMLKGVLLDIGCGEMPYREYIMEHSSVSSYVGLDIENPIYQQDVKPDVFWDGEHIPFEDSSIDCMIATEFLEHIYEPKIVLSEIFRVLKPNGFLFFTVPFFWPLHTTPHDHYRYTPFSLTKMFEECGFAESKIYPHGGWDGAMAQMIGLWANRRPMSEIQRADVREWFFPLYKELLERDISIDSFEGNSMFTGLYGFAFKGTPRAFHEYYISEEPNKDDIVLKFASRVAVFGCGLSGKKTIDYIHKNFGKKITYIIDDSRCCDHQNLTSLTTEAFLTKQTEVDLVVFGREQKLNPMLIKNLKIPYLRLGNII